MKRIVSALSGIALLATFAAQPLSAEPLRLPAASLQIAETTAASGVERRAGKIPDRGGRERRSVPFPEDANAQPPGAQALMVLGIALIVSPAMFRGAFSN